MLVLRADRDIDEGLRHKVAMQSDVAPDAVVAALDRSNLYEVPLGLREQGLDVREVDHGAAGLRILR